MAVEAATDCLTGVDRDSIRSLFLGTTTGPFADRLNAGIVAGALGLDERTSAHDSTGSWRAGTTGLLAAFDAAAARQSAALCVAADRRRTPAATAQELSAGHAAAALLVTPEAGVARLVGFSSLTVDFVDHHRGADREFDYHWEDRWVRDEGYLKLVPRLIADLLADSGIRADQVTHFCLPCPLRRVDVAVAKQAGLPATSVRDGLANGCGDSGAAHPLLLLVRTLEQAAPGEMILTVGFGQGGDALLFEVTEAIVAYRERRTGVSKWLRRRSPCAYSRYLALNDLVKIDRGLRAEADRGTALTAQYRHRDFLLGLVGGMCETCRTHQLPRTTICANPDCGAVNTQVPYSFAASVGRVATWSADYLTYTPDPPAYYGMIDFAEGGRLMMDFANVGPDGIRVGAPMRMVFRVKDRDALRGFTRYFWKAAPLEPEES